MERPHNRAIYRLGDVERWRVSDLDRRGELTEAVLAQAETLAREGHNFTVIKTLHLRRGEWSLGRGELSQAIEELGHSVRMAREADGEDVFCEALLALARLRSGDPFDARAEAERLSRAGPRSIAVAELWRELGDRDHAVHHALRVHERYIGDGEPFVFRHFLDRTRALLIELGAPLPEVPKYDPATAKIYPWEKDVRAFIEKLKAERAEKKKKEAKPKSGKTKKVKRKSRPKDKDTRGKRVRRKKATE